MNSPVNRTFGSRIIHFRTSSQREKREGSIEKLARMEILKTWSLLSRKPDNFIGKRHKTKTSTVMIQK